MDCWELSKLKSPVFTTNVRFLPSGTGAYKFLHDLLQFKKKYSSSTTHATVSSAKLRPPAFVLAGILQFLRGGGEPTPGRKTKYNTHTHPGYLIVEAGREAGRMPPACAGQAKRWSTHLSPPPNIEKSAYSRGRLHAQRLGP